MRLNSDFGPTITLSQIVKTLRANKKKIFLISFLCTFLLVGWRLVMPLKYVGEGIFREKANNSNQGSSSSIALTLVAGMNVEKSEGKVLMCSSVVLERVIQELNLQGVIREEMFLQRLIRRICDNFSVEINYLLGLKKMAPEKPPTPLEISALRFQGEYPLEFTIRFISEDLFELDSYDGHRVGVGRLDTPFETPEYSFTITKKGKENSAGKAYNLKLLPMQMVVSDLRSRLEIESEKDAPLLIRLTYLDQRNTIAANVVNGIMKAYHNLLKLEHQRTAHEQVDYLNDRQSEMNQDLAALLRDYAHTLETDLAAFGYAETGTAIKFFSDQFQEFHKRTQRIDLELKQLEAVLEGPIERLVDVYLSVADAPHFMMELIDSLVALRREAHMIDISFSKEEYSPEMYAELNLAGSQVLLETYNKQLAESEYQVVQNGFLLQQISNPQIELQAVASLIQDPAMKQSIHQSHDLAFQLHDERNRGTKERERIQKELELKRYFLGGQVEKAHDLSKLHRMQLSNNIQQLQKKRFLLMQEKIALLEEQFKEAIKTHIQNQKEEKFVLEQRAEKLQRELMLLPEKWIAEKTISERLSIHTKMLEEVSKLVESKNINSNLEMIKSAPVVPAIQMTHPKRPYLFLYLFVGLVVGFILASAICIASHVLKDRFLDE